MKTNELYRVNIFNYHKLKREKEINFIELYSENVNLNTCNIENCRNYTPIVVSLVIRCKM